jgi:hypothetical protein
MRSGLLRQPSIRCIRECSFSPHETRESEFRSQKHTKYLTVDDTHSAAEKRFTGEFPQVTAAVEKDCIMMLTTLTGDLQIWKVTTQAGCEKQYVKVRIALHYQLVNMEPEGTST